MSFLPGAMAQRMEMLKHIFAGSQILNCVFGGAVGASGLTCLCVLRETDWRFLLYEGCS